MNCVEFERVLPEFLEGVHTPEQQAHLGSCPSCSNLLADLATISQQAKTLLAWEEPGPSVWNEIQAQLQREGLIRRSESVIPTQGFFARRRMAWLVPVAAALAIVAALKLYHPAAIGDSSPIAKQKITSPRPVAPAFSGEDQQVLNTVAARPSAQPATYRADLDSANSFIHDAEESAKEDPDDAYTQQLLINAYEQKQMLYDLALDRSTQ
jgi:hypothetical protein